MKKSVILLILLGLLLLSSGCGNDNFAGTYVGYSWGGETRGVSLSDATRYIETILKLNEKGIIEDAKILYFQKQDGYWTIRQSGNAYVEVDFAVEPTAAKPGANYQAGESMFIIHTANLMSFYAVAVDSSETVAVALVDPVTRYQFEIKLRPGFDYTRPVSDLTIGSDLIVPTIRTSGSGVLRPEEWDSLADKTFFDIDIWSHVVNESGVLKDIDQASSIQEFLQALGVEFEEGQLKEMSVQYGYFGLGGWSGNYQAVEEYLIGQDATQLTSLVDWSFSPYRNAINERNQFGIDVETGATRTVQDSINTISGATVRMSRESTSYQRALVDAGIINEEDVIIGRF